MDYIFEPAFSTSVICSYYLCPDCINASCSNNLSCSGCYAPASIGGGMN